MSFRAPRTLAVLSAVAMTTAAVALSAQGRCIRAYGTPACNTDPIPPAFAKTGWRTTGLDHITWRVVDPQAEAAFYAAVMGWRSRSSSDAKVVMDIGDWGTAVFEKMPAPGPAARAVVTGYGFSIEPWNAKTVEQDLKRRGMTPVADNDGKGFESFHVKDVDGFDLQVSNGRNQSARQKPASVKLTASAPFESTGWQTVWLDHFSFNAKNYKASVSFYVNLLGWGPTYDEGSQNELMIGEVGDTIIRGGNALAPGFNPDGGGRAGSIDHISFGISPWDTDGVRAELEKRNLRVTVDTSDGAEIHVAQFKSYHTQTPNGYNLQISYNTHDTRLNLAIAVNPRRGVK